LIDPEEAELWMAFYHEKYTGEKDCGPDHYDSRWVGLTTENLIESGYDPKKAKATINWVKRFATERLKKHAKEDEI